MVDSMVAGRRVGPRSAQQRRWYADAAGAPRETARLDPQTRRDRQDDAKRDDVAV